MSEIFHFQSNRCERENNSLKHHQLLLILIKGQDSCLCSFKQRRDEIEEMLLSRENDTTNSVLLTSIFDRLRNSDVRTLRLEKVCYEIDLNLDGNQNDSIFS